MGDLARLGPFPGPSRVAASGLDLAVGAHRAGLAGGGAGTRGAALRRGAALGGSGVAFWHRRGAGEPVALLGVDQLVVGEALLVDAGPGLVELGLGALALGLGLGELGLLLGLAGLGGSRSSASLAMLAG